MNSARTAALGDELHQALLTHLPVAPLTERGLELSVEEAYGIQRHIVARRVEAGEVLVGRKIGLTSEAVQAALHVREPDFGCLLSGMVYNSGEAVACATLIQPRAQGEIAFILKRDLIGPGVTRGDVLRATDYLMPCFEIVDSRIRDWRIKIQDAVADNASSGVLVLGDRVVDPARVDLRLCGMVLEKNGEVVDTGAGAAVLGHPANAVAWLANTLGQLGTALRAGEIILSGSLAGLVPLQAGDNLQMTIGGIGGCSVRFS